MERLYKMLFKHQHGHGLQSSRIMMSYQKHIWDKFKKDATQWSYFVLHCQNFNLEAKKCFEKIVWKIFEVNVCKIATSIFENSKSFLYIHWSCIIF